MANQLGMAEQHSILVLARRGWSQRRIGRELGIRRETVSRYVKLARGKPVPAHPPPEPQSKPAHSITGSNEPEWHSESRFGRCGVSSSGEADSKPAHSITGFAGRQSQCAPYLEIILGKLEEGLSAQRIWQDLVSEHGFADGYQSVQRFVRRLRSRTPLPFRRMETPPGEQAQIDFGLGAPVIIPEGEALPFGVKTRRRKTHVFRMVLSCSRKAYSEVVYRQTAENFIRCLENAFHYFGGVPKVLVVDNLKAAVLQADWYDPDLNPKIQAFAEHYGTVILPTRPRTPRHKGKIENQIGYVKNNALKGRTFPSLAAQNTHLLEWEAHVADTRIHGTTKQQINKVFEAVERSALTPLPLERFPFFQEAQRVVSRDAHVEVAKAFYSVPPQYLGRRVWVRWDGRMVRVFDPRMQPIAVHTQSEPGRFRTQPEHIAPEKISGVERGATYLLRKVSVMGSNAEAWSQSMLQTRGIQGVRVLVGLLSLGERHAWNVIDEVCAIAQTHGAYRLRTIRTLIRRTAPKQEQFEFIEEHPIIRRLSDYGDLVRKAFQETSV
jgi:transposase